MASTWLMASTRGFDGGRLLTETGERKACEKERKSFVTNKMNKV